VGEPVRIFERTVFERTVFERTTYPANELEMSDIF
jgi:hypothetical protein